MALNALAQFEAYAAGTLLVLDLVGTFVFALSGAVAVVKERLDLFGVLVLSFAAGNAGGITRDLLIGAVPPGAISDWRYLAVSLLAGLVVFFWYPISERLRNLSSLILIFDAAGLALFAVVGTQKALGYGLNPVMAPLLGMLSGIGGGMLRDVLVAQIPTVLRAELYAVAALAGASGGSGSYAGHSADRDGNRRRGPLLRDSSHCHTARLASPGRRSTATVGVARRGRGRSAG